MNRLAPLALATTLLALGAGVSAQQASPHVAQQEREPTVYAEVPARNGYTYPLDDSRCLIVVIDEGATYLDPAANAAIVHVFVKSARDGWGEYAQPTGVKGCAELGDAVAGQSFGLANLEEGAE